jgi:leader peptidase (prepilin peptidase) / N-methyltransferase
VLLFFPTPNSLSFLLFAILISIVDLRSYRIPDTLLAIAAFVSILLACIFDRSNVLYRFLLSGGSFLLLYLFSLVVTSGLGFGDVKFISIAAFNLGIFDAWVMLTVACLLGIGFGLLRRLIGKNDPARKNKIPFAPFLCLGILASLFANPPIL